MVRQLAIKWEPVSRIKADKSGWTLCLGEPGNLAAASVPELEAPRAHKKTAALKHIELEEESQEDPEE